MPVIISPAIYRQRESQISFLLPAAIAGALLLFHLFFNFMDSYGIFRDEFYYLAGSRRLAWGYVDQPPLSLFLLKLQTALAGDSLQAIRLLPALALSGTVFLTGIMVQQLGGNRLAVALACIAVATGPIYIGMGGFYSMNSIDIFLWSAAICLMISIIHRPAPGRWLLLGLILGVGLLNKVGFLWLGAGLFVGMLLTPLRKQLLTPWPYMAAGIAFLMFLPFIIWNINHDFAHLEFMQNAMAFKYNGISRGDFIRGMFEMLNPLSVVLWLPGLYFFLFSGHRRSYRLLGILFLTVFLILLVNGHSKSEYIAPVFPVLFAGGAVFLDNKLKGISRKRILFPMLVVLFVSSLLLAPIMKPILPVDTFISYSERLGFPQKNSEGKEVKQLPQFYADRFGWEELAAKSSDVFLSLSPQEQKEALIYTQNYGEAGALEYYQRNYALPPVISGHNAYWHWSRGEKELRTLIVVGGKKEDHERAFEEVSVAAIHHSRHAMPYEDNLPVYICRQPKINYQLLWENIKHYD